MSEAPETRYCRQCEKQLYGRIDQVYCNDNCRNTFNKNKAKQKKIEPHPNQKAIFKIIKRNYDIMQRAYPNPIRPERYEYVPLHKMDKDFDPDFFTSIHQTSTGLWYVCFDRGWQVIGERYHMKDFPEKTWLRDSDLKLNK